MKLAGDDIDNVTIQTSLPEVVFAYCLSVIINSVPFIIKIVSIWEINYMVTVLTGEVKTVKKDPICSESSPENPMLTHVGYKSPYS